MDGTHREISGEDVRRAKKHNTCWSTLVLCAIVELCQGLVRFGLTVYHAAHLTRIQDALGSSTVMLCHASRCAKWLPFGPKWRHQHNIFSAEIRWSH